MYYGQLFSMWIVEQYNSPFLYESGHIIIIVASIVVVILTVFIFYVSDSRIFDINGRRVPGPNSNLYGHSLRAVVIKARANKQASVAMKEILLDKAGNGNICGANVFGKRLIILAHPEYMKVVMMGNHFQFPKSPIYDRTRFIFGDGILTNTGKMASYLLHKLTQCFTITVVIVVHFIYIIIYIIIQVKNGNLIVTLSMWAFMRKYSRK